MKLKFKLLLAIVVVCLIITTSIFLLNRPEQKFATVITVEPIKSYHIIEHENCSMLGLLDGFNQGYLSRYHPAERECKMVFMIETLQSKSLPALVDRDNRKCVITQTSQQIIVGYDVIYRIGDTLGKVRTAYEPGLFIPLDENGRLDLSTSSNQLCETTRSNRDALIPFYCVNEDEMRTNTMNNALEIYPARHTYAYFD